MKLYLVRHGETNGNRGIFTGKEPELTEVGIEQAKRAGIYFKNKKINKIYCSKMIRAKQTLSYIKPYLKGIKIVYRGDLNEKSKGIYAYKPEEYKKAVEKSGLKEHLFRPPKGENVEDLEKRAEKVFRFLKKKHGKDIVLISSHGHFMRLLINRIFKHHIRETKYFALHNAGISYFKFDKDFKIRGCEIDDYKHLIEFSSYPRKKVEVEI